MDVDEHMLYGDSPTCGNETTQAAPATVNEHALLGEFKMAAQSLIKVWSEGESVDYPEELQRHIDWFRELLA
ncbi:hypothetical protein [Rhizobium leguminosarum]